MLYGIPGCRRCQVHSCRGGLLPRKRDGKKENNRRPLFRLVFPEWCGIIEAGRFRSAEKRGGQLSGLSGFRQLAEGCLEPGNNLHSSRRNPNHGNEKHGGGKEGSGRSEETARGDHRLRRNQPDPHDSLQRDSGGRAGRLLRHQSREAHRVSGKVRREAGTVFREVG